MANPATETTTCSRVQQNSPLMKLPVELRIAIYDLALDHIVDDIVARAKHDKDHVTQRARLMPACFPFTGALAIPHTSYDLRIESTGIMKPLAKAKAEVLETVARRPLNTFIDSNEELARLNAWDLSFRIVKGLQWMTVDQNTLPVWCARVPWSELNRAQKRCVAIEIYKRLSREEQACLDEAATGSKEVIFWTALVEVFDGRVERGEMEDFRGVAGFRAAFGAAS